MSNDTQTVTLTDFLLARIAEDEGVARNARPHEYLSTRDKSPLDWLRLNGYAMVTATSGRVLAECEAKRQIVDKVYDVRGVAGIHLDEVLRLLALPYADHPDYRDEWRP